MRKHLKACLAIAGPAILAANLAWGMVTPNTRTFTAGQESTVQGVIISRDGNMLKLRADDDSIGTIDLTDATKIQLKSGVIFHKKTSMNLEALVPGLHVEAKGKGNDKGELMADRVTFDPNSMRASKQIDTRVSPLEARTGSLEGRTSSIEGRASQMESRQGTLEDQQHQMGDRLGQVGDRLGQVKSEADMATTGVGDVNRRVSDIDNYDVKDTAIIYFKPNSAALSADAKRDLEDLAKKAVAEKGYMVEIAGFADSTGKPMLNQILSEQRATAVIRYLEQEGDVPVRRILAPAGMGTSHEAADNSTREGRKMNRRVEVKVLVSQGIVAGATMPNNSGTKPPSDSNSQHQ